MRNDMELYKDKPIFYTIQQLLKFKNFTTLSEISKISGIKQQKVLEVINTNGHGVYRLDKNGRITKISFSNTRNSMWEGGNYYKIREDSLYSRKHFDIVTKLHSDLYNKLKSDYIDGYYGQHTVTDIKYTDENLNIILEYGLKPWFPPTDYELWKE